MSLNNLSIITKIVIFLSALGLVTLGTTLLGNLSIQGIDDRYSEIIEHDVKAMLDLARSNRNIAWYARSIDHLILAETEAENAAATAEINQSRTTILSLLNDAMQRMPSIQPRVTALLEQFKRVEDACHEVIRLGNDTSDPTAERKARTLLFQTCTPEVAKLIPMTMKVADDVVQGVEQTKLDATATTVSTVRTVYAIGFSGLAVVLIGAVMLSLRTITQPIGRILKTMGTMTSGDLQVRIADTGRGDEVGAIARALENFRLGLVEAERLRIAQEASKSAEAERTNRRAATAERFAGRMRDIAEAFNRSSREVADAARTMSATAEETARQAQTVSGAAEEASTSVQTVAASTEEMSASIREIAAQVSRSTDVVAVAAREAARTETDVQALSEAAGKIGEVVELINSIAGQTNLLALNATIEAARAGDAGRGFAVVASEVKQLAAETARATDEIGSKIAEIQTATNRTVTSIERIVSTINQVREISSTIASAIEEQGAATGEIASNTQVAARGTSDVTSNIHGVGHAAEMTGSASTQLMSLSGGLNSQAADLQREVAQFIEQIRAA